MASIPGSVPVTGPIAPTDTADTYPVVDLQYAKGGYRSVQSLAERNSIPAARRSAGMKVYVIDTALEYLLEADLTTWTTVTVPAGIYLPLSGGTMSGPMTVLSPINPTEPATKEYVDTVAANIVNGTNWKVEPAKGVITGAEATSGTYTTSDGVVLTVGDRVVRNSTSSPDKNGIYVVSAGTWSRSSDANTGAKLKSAAVIVQQGTVYADTIMLVATDGTPTLEVTPITWIMLSRAFVPVAGTGITIAGSTIAVDQTVVEMATTSVATQSGTNLNFNNYRQNRATVVGTPEAITISSFSNTGVKKSVFLVIDSKNAEDTFTIAVAGSTILNQGFSFIGGVVNHAIILHLDTLPVPTFLLTINPII